VDTLIIIPRKYKRKTRRWQVRRNKKRKRKLTGFFFSSLIMTITWGGTNRILNSHELQVPLLDRANDGCLTGYSALERNQFGKS